MKGLKESEVLCSESLFRCISPTMDIIPVTIFRLAPNSFIADATQLTLSVTNKTSFPYLVASLLSEPVGSI